jgi:CO/xanthine dehydrogenase FAD-binding subunit
MYPGPLEYHRPDDLAEAIAMMGEFGDEGRVIAGGQSLLARLRQRRVPVRYLIDIRRIGRICGVRRERDAVVIGAAATHALIERSAVVAETFPVLARVAGVIGDPAIRSLGTLGGSLAEAAPHADWPAVVLAFGSDVVVANPQGEKRIPAGEYFTSGRQTSLEATDLITSVRFRIQPQQTGVAYVKQPEPASGWALCGVAALVTLDENGAIGRARVAITGMGPVPIRLKSVERSLIGRPPDAAALRAAAARADEDIEMEDGEAGTVAYRANLARVWTDRALRTAVAATIR